MKPMYNALAAGKVLPNQPSTPARPASAATATSPPNNSTKPPAPSTKPAVPNFNARPNKDANAGQSPGMIGDRQKVSAPPTPRIAAAAPTGRAQDARSGVETAMGSLADQLHPVKRR